MLASLRGVLAGINASIARRGRTVLNYSWTMQYGDKIIRHVPAPHRFAPSRTVECVLAKPVLETPEIQEAQELGGYVYDAQLAERLVNRSTLKSLKALLEPAYPDVASISRKSALLAFLQQNPLALELIK
jgi:hypothetical protein